MAIRSTLSLSKTGSQLIEKKSTSEFSIKVANTLDEREAVFNLGYKIYLEKGFINENVQERLVQNYDANSETIILIVQDQYKNIAGSVTLVFENSSILPAEKIYGEEIRKLKSSGNKIVELSRLVISPEYRNSKEILVLLFNYLAIYSYHVKKYSHLVVEVNPRHKNYYQLLLCFEEIGEVKPCPSVQNAPANLLCLPLKKYRTEVVRCSNLSEPNKKERSLYPYFIKSEQENLVAHYLKNQAKPITSEEKIYFGFSESSIGNSVCI
jgi:hypothetical protein